ncbi:MAG: hypothetical protein OEU26_12915 [Candidatus Tectomicrobia bacterium]|nr:hypothetical protein [Candidatus Tectomicrobia bacterium]
MGENALDHARVVDECEEPEAPARIPNQHALTPGNSQLPRAAHKAITDATEQLERVQSDPQSAEDEPEKRRPGRPPKNPVSLEQAEQALDAARGEHERLFEQFRFTHQLVSPRKH